MSLYKDLFSLVSNDIGSLYGFQLRRIGLRLMPWDMKSVELQEVLFDFERQQTKEARDGDSIFLVVGFE